MPDMLVKLYDLPPLEPLLEGQRANGIIIRRALAPEKHHVLDWAARHFSKGGPANVMWRFLTRRFRFSSPRRRVVSSVLPVMMRRVSIFSGQLA